MNARVRLRDRDARDVVVLALVRVNFLTFERPIDGLQTIAEERGPFELEALGGSLHLGTDLPRDHVLPAFEE